VPAWKSHSQLCQALSRGARLLKWEAPERSMLFRKGARPLLDVAKRQSTTVLGAVITLSLLLGAFVPMIGASGLGASDPLSQGLVSGIIKVNGTNLELNGSVIHFHGINDQTVIPLNLYPYPQYDYRFSNHLFPNYTGDASAKLPSASYREFWWQYFYLVHELGLNCVRLGAFSDWSLSWLITIWYNDRALWDSVVDPMFAMAEANGVYIIFGFGGATNTERFDRTTYEFGNGMNNPTSGSIFTVGSETYNEYVSWMGEVMRHYQNETSLAIWDIFNEPDTDDNYYGYWQFLADPGTAFNSWVENITADAIAEDHHHLTLLGIAGQGVFPYYESYTFSHLRNNADVLGCHIYGHVEDESYISAADVIYQSLNKPVLYGEAGRDNNINSYWPWLGTMFTKYGWSSCLMTLQEYPGYPITQSVMDSIPAPPNPPSAPSSPLAIAGVGSITLTWSAPASNGGAAVTGYKVYRASSAGGEGSIPITTVGVAYSWTDPGLATGSTFYYKITASNSAGEGGRSVEVSATTPTVPSAPMNLAATPLNGQVTISWQAPQSNGGLGVTSYSILRGTMSGAETLLASTSGTSYADNELTNGQAYYYLVKAINAIGTGPASNEASAVPKAVPTAPNSPSAVGGVGSITLSWSAPTSNGDILITGYNVYQGSSAGNEGAVPVAALTDAYSWTDSGLPGASTFYYCVSAINAVGEGARSTEVFASTPGAPGVPVYLNAQAGSNSVLLTWMDPTSNGGSIITAYRIYMATDGNAESLLISLGPSEHSHNVTGLLAGHTYTFLFSAANAVGEGLKCPGVTMTLPDTSAPGDDPAEVQTGLAQSVGLALSGAAVALVATMGFFIIWYRRRD